MLVFLWSPLLLPLLPKACVHPMVGHMEEQRVLVRSLHLLHCRTTLSDAVRASVIASWMFGSEDVLLAILPPTIAIIDRPFEDSSGG